MYVLTMIQQNHHFPNQMYRTGRVGSQILIFRGLCCTMFLNINS